MWNGNLQGKRKDILEPASNKASVPKEDAPILKTWLVPISVPVPKAPIEMKESHMARKAWIGVS